MQMLPSLDCRVVSVRAARFYRLLVEFKWLKKKEGSMIQKFQSRSIVIATAFLVFLVMPASTHAKRYLSLGTGNSGGSYYILGAGFAAIFNRYVPEVRVIAESTSGSEENFNLILRKKLDFGLAGFGVIPPALEKKRDLSGIRIVAVGHSAQCHWIVRKESPIRKLSDFRGRRVAVGAPGTGTLIMSKEVLMTLTGYSFEDFKPAYLSFSESVSGLKDSTIDVALVWAASPVPIIVDLSRQIAIRLISLTPAEVKTLTDAQPYYVDIAIPGGTYKGIDTNTITFGGITALFCRQDLDEDLVERVVRAICEHPQEKEAIHPLARQWNLKNAFRGAGYATKYIPFHPGAIKYFREKRLWN